MDRRVTEHEWRHVIDLLDGSSTPDRPGPLPEAQEADRNWKRRAGVRGRSCAILAS
jgi:hypothetical protein